MTGTGGASSKIVDRLWQLLDRPLLDWAIAAVATALVWWRASRPLLDVNATQLTAALAALSAVLALVGTFGTTAIMFFADRRDRISNDLRKRYGLLLRRSLLGTFGTMVTTALGCAIALLFIGGSFSRIFFVFALALAFTKVLRTLVLFAGLIDADDRSEYLREHPAPRLVTHGR